MHRACKTQEMTHEPRVAGKQHRPPAQRLPKGRYKPKKARVQGGIKPPTYRSNGKLCGRRSKPEPAGKQGISNASKKKTNGPAPTHPCRHRPEMWCLISPNATGSSSSTTCSTRNSLRASWKGRGLRRGMSARSLRMMRFVRSAGKKSAADWLSGYFSSSTRTARQGSASRPRCPKP